MTGDSRSDSGRTRASASFLFLLLVFCYMSSGICFLTSRAAFASDQTLRLQDLIVEALHSHEILMSESRALAAQYKIPQAMSLPDPLFTFGYQNDSWNKYTLGKSDDSQWMFSVSQSFLFPGKRGLKGDMASRDAESLSALHDAARLRTIARIKELYYDLFFAYKNIDLIRDRANLFSKVEDAALARYSSGTGSQQEVLMAQTEKYMLLEKEEMLKQKIQSLEAMLNSTIGRDINSRLGRPVEPPLSEFNRDMNEVISLAYENSPEIKSREKMIASAETKVRIAQKEYYPDFTVAASVFKRAGDFEDMWSLTTTINIPIFYKDKQDQAVHEAEASMSEARHELEGAKSMLSSSIRDNLSMLKAAERLMDLYKNGLIPKTYQDFELLLSGYATGRTEAITVITRLKSVLDYEISYWSQFAEHEKAIARIEAITGLSRTTITDGAGN